MVKVRKFHEIKAAVGEMPRYDRGDGTYLEVHYDMSEDEVYTHYHCCFGHNSWTNYHDSDVVFVGFYDEHVPMRELRADIECAIERHEENRRQWEAEQAYFQ